MKYNCSVCKKKFTHKKTETLVGKLGPIPVNLCKTDLKKIMKNDELYLNDKIGRASCRERV